MTACKMAATSIYVDPPTQADIDMLSGIVYVGGTMEPLSAELPTRFPDGLLLLLRVLRRVLRDEGRALEAGVAVHGADEGAEGQCALLCVVSTIEPRDSIAPAEPRRSRTLERGHGDSPRHRRRLRRSRPVAAGRHSGTNILLIPLIPSLTTASCILLR